MPGAATASAQACNACYFTPKEGIRGLVGLETRQATSITSHDVGGALEQNICVCAACGSQFCQLSGAEIHMRHTAHTIPDGQPVDWPVNREEEEGDRPSHTPTRTRQQVHATSRCA